MGNEKERVMTHYNKGNTKEISQESALKILKNNIGIDFEDTLKKLRDLDSKMYKEFKNAVSTNGWKGVDAVEAKPALEEFYITPVENNVIIVRVFSACLIYDESKADVFINKIAEGCKKATGLARELGITHVTYPRRQISAGRFVLGAMYFNILNTHDSKPAHTKESAELLPPPQLIEENAIDNIRWGWSDFANEFVKDNMLNDSIGISKTDFENGVYRTTYDVSRVDKILHDIASRFMYIAKSNIPKMSDIVCEKINQEDMFYDTRTLPPTLAHTAILGVRLIYSPSDEIRYNTLYSNIRLELEKFYKSKNEYNTVLNNIRYVKRKLKDKRILLNLIYFKAVTQ